MGRAKDSVFARRLGEQSPDEADGRHWLFVPYDQLGDGIGPLAEEAPESLGIVLVESPWKARLRPYHKQKLALVLANLRQFALEQANRGVAVRHVVANGPYRDALAPLAEELGTLRVMRPAERELRADLAPLIASGALEEVPHAGWLTTTDDFERGAGPKPPWRMDRFYRHVRRRAEILVDGEGKPTGGKWSFDADNRKAWRGDPPAPSLPRFRPDEVTLEACELVAEHFAGHPGQLDPGALPATRANAERWLAWALDECLETFGPYEDAMAREEPVLFHTHLSPLINLHRLSPREVLEAVLAREDVPLASREGFVRQLIGWREFVHHVHERTDGFRLVDGRRLSVDEEPGDAGFGDWSEDPPERSTLPRGDDVAPSDAPTLDGGARPSFLGARGSLPPAFWGTRSGLECLDHTVSGVWKTGYSHHILRLMVLSNLATLLDVTPRELGDWFWVAYVDAYDWVVEPNVLAMGTFATGELMTTKPYVSGAAYIDRMSDFCAACAFDPKRNCPITSLYWAFLERKRGLLEGNPRVAMPLRSLEKRAESRKQQDAEVFRHVRRVLERGEVIDTEDLP